MAGIAMLPGISGSLIAPAFLATVLAEEFCSAFADVARVRRLHRWWRRVEQTLGPAASARAVADIGAMPLFEALGFDIERLEPHREGFVGTLARRGVTCVALRICPWGADTDAAWRDTIRVGRTAGIRWGIVYAGATLRLVDATRPWSRRALDFDLALTFTHERSAVTFVTILDAAGAEMDGKDPSPLGLLLTRSDRHGVDVCSTLGDGVLEALAALVTALDAGNGRRARTVLDRVVFEQAVTVVYRLLFLLFAEARALVPTWHHVYRDGYTIDALCQRFMTQPARRGLWKTLQAIARLAHTGCHAGDLVVTPFNGRLFSPRHTPLAEHAQVPDPVIGQAVLALATRSGRRARERIAYADLGVEQLGAVYERVLEYEPARRAGTLRLTHTSHDRKSTGSFYTPRAVTDFLVRRALHPLVTGRSAEEIFRLRVLDPAMGSGAFLVGACRYLGDAAERASVEERGVPTDRGPVAPSEARRAVAQRCLFGVDLNPMAVQLARLSLWLASLAGDRPLAFLDHHLAAADSLIGASLTDLARNPGISRRRGRGREDPLPLFGIEASRQIATSVLPERFRIATEPGDTPAAVREKEQMLAELSAPGTPLSGWKQAADLWCAAWFWDHHRLTSGVYADLLGALTGGGSALTAAQRASILNRAAGTARARRFFHWELEFPEVFFTPDGRRDPDGGFDAVIGNPPWDVLRADTGPRAERDRTRADQVTRRRFFREAQVYRHQGGGHANQYQLFIERALQLTRPGGRIALILPSGVATDHGSAAVRRAMLDALDIDRLLGFDNREVIFPIHRDVRFLLVTGTKGGYTHRLTGAFGRSDPAWLDRLPDGVADDPAEARPIVLSRSLLASWDPEHVGIPWLSSRHDVDLLATISDTVPQLGDNRGWGTRFGRELNATEDRRHFSPLGTSADSSLLKIVEGKHLEPFRVLTANATMGVTVARAATVVEAARSFERTRLAYRDVASATNRVTLIAALLPRGTISTHTVFCSKSLLGEEAQYCLLALLNSLVANYLVRLQVTTHVTCALMARLAVPRPRSTSPEFRELAALARSLAQTGLAEHEAAYARINAVAAQLYGLTRSQYDHLLSTFPLLPKELISLCSAAYREN